MQRVIAYIDGFNLYYGLRSKNWKWFYWLNIQEMSQRLLKPDQTLVATRYFTTVVTQPADQHRRQAAYLEALRTLHDLDVYLGHYLSSAVTCRNCGHTHETHHEKMTDVNIAVQLMSDAFQDRFDVALLVSADSDLVGPIQAIQQLFPQKVIVMAFPPGRYSNALNRAANAYTFIGRNVLSKSVFPDRILKADGFVLHRPIEWH